MNLSDIPAALGITRAALARYTGQTPQNLAKYLDGERLNPSKPVARILKFSQLNMEAVIFGDSFAHPDGENRDHPAYWVNLAIEAINEAVKRGLPESEASDLISNLIEAVGPLLSEDEGAPEIFLKKVDEIFGGVLPSVVSLYHQSQ